MPDLCLTSESAYQTGGRPASRLGSCCPTAVFYSKILGIVYRASKLAKKGLYDNQRWIEAASQRSDRWSLLAAASTFRGSMSSCRCRLRAFLSETT